MRKILFQFILCLPLLTNGQEIPDLLFEQAMSKWVYHYSGNPIDGTKRTALRISNESEDENLFILSVQNTSEIIKIKNSTGDGDNDRDNIIIDIRSSIEVDNINEIFMYFNNQNKFYKINFRSYGSNGILWWNGISDDNSEFISRFDFINLLKINDEVFFRVKYSNSKDVNFSFSLNGSTSTINKVVDISNFNPGDKNNFYMDMTNGLLKLRNVLYEIEKKGDILKLNIKREVLDNELIDHLFKEFSDYVFTFISFKYNGNPNLDILDLNDKFLKNIDLNQFKKTNRGTEKN